MRAVGTIKISSSMVAFPVTFLRPLLQIGDERAGAAGGYRMVLTLIWPVAGLDAAVPPRLQGGNRPAGNSGGMQSSLNNPALSR